MDENKERRKHYQDLAGIENYASKFDNAGIIKAPLILCVCVCVRPSVRPCKYMVYNLQPVESGFF